MAEIPPHCDRAAWDAEAAREFVRPAAWQRALGGLRRRWQGRPVALQPAVAAAVGWLRDFASPQGLATSYGPGLGEPVICPAATATGVATLAAYGEMPLVRGWFRGLLSCQRADGAILDATGQSASLFNTGRFVEAAVALAPDVKAAEPLARAASFLAAHVDDRGRLQWAERGGGSLDALAAPAIHLSWAPALLAAADLMREPRWRAAGERLVSHLNRSCDMSHWNAPTHLYLRGLLGLAQLKMIPTASAVLLQLAAAQCRDGSLPAQPRARWTSAPGLALAARLWSVVGEHPRADRALAAIAHAQQPGGGLPGSWGPGAVDFPTRAVTWSALYFLDAVQERVAGAFAGKADDVPARIDPRDGRARAVLRWAEQLEPTARIADVGCGRGRYLRLVEEARPRARLVAIDPSRALLSGLSSRVARREGSLLRLPAADGEFDAVLAVESLEHALLPERAVAELARAVFPGGSILVIDKNQARQPRSQHASWERWFAPAEMSHWLARHCDLVNATPLSHGPHADPDGLYWMWLGHKRHAQCRAAA